MKHIPKKIYVGNQNKGRLLVLRTLVENQKGLLRSGMFGKVNLTIKKKDQTVVIAEEALFSEQSSKFVWLVENGVVKKIPVTVGLRLNKEVEIISGLSKGDTVVVAGHLKLRKDGQSVLAVNKN